MSVDPLLKVAVNDLNTAVTAHDGAKAQELLEQISLLNPAFGDRLLDSIIQQGGANLALNSVQEMHQ